MHVSSHIIFTHLYCGYYNWLSFNDFYDDNFLKLLKFFKAYYHEKAYLNLFLQCSQKKQDLWNFFLSAIRLSMGYTLF